MDLCILTVTSSQIIIVLGILTDCVLAPEVKGLENGWHMGSHKFLNATKKQIAVSYDQFSELAAQTFHSTRLYVLFIFIHFK